jgi:hypothetical protein
MRLQGRPERCSKRAECNIGHVTFGGRGRQASQQDEAPGQEPHFSVWLMVAVPIRNACAGGGDDCPVNKLADLASFLSWLFEFDGLPMAFFIFLISACVGPRRVRRPASGPFVPRTTRGPRG